MHKELITYNHREVWMGSMVLTYPWNELTIITVTQFQSTKQPVGDRLPADNLFTGNRPQNNSSYFKGWMDAEVTSEFLYTAS